MFRIFDHCLANGIEAIFGFSIGLLKKNEEKLLELKFDEILDFLNNKVLDQYRVNVFSLTIASSTLTLIRYSKMGPTSSPPNMMSMVLSPMPCLSRSLPSCSTVIDMNTKIWLYVGHSENGTISLTCILCSVKQTNMLCRWTICGTITAPYPSNGW